MGQILIENAPEQLKSDALRSKMELDGCGSVVSFIGLTRGVDDGVEVHPVSYTHLTLPTKA